MQDLNRSENLGRDEHPKTLTEEFHLLVRESREHETSRKVSNRHRQRVWCGGRGKKSFIFVQKGRGGRGNGNINFSRIITDDRWNFAGMDGETLPNILCFGCSFHGHYHITCPCEIRSAVVYMYVGHMITQDESFSIPRSLLLLDACSTCDASNNL